MNQVSKFIVLMKRKQRKNDNRTWYKCRHCKIETLHPYYHILSTHHNIDVDFRESKIVEENFVPFVPALSWR